MQIGIIKCVCVFFFLFQRFFVIVEKYLAREGSIEHNAFSIVT